MEHAVDVDRCCSEVISLLLFLASHSHTPVSIEWRQTSEIWRSASLDVGLFTLDPKGLRTPTSRTTYQGIHKLTGGSKPPDARTPCKVEVVILRETL